MMRTPRFDSEATEVAGENAQAMQLPKRPRRGEPPQAASNPPLSASRQKGAPLGPFFFDQGSGGMMRTRRFDSEATEVAGENAQATQLPKRPRRGDRPAHSTLCPIPAKLAGTKEPAATS
jgi:hypothetical protein